MLDMYSRHEYEQAPNTVNTGFDNEFIYPSPTKDLRSSYKW